MHTIFNITTTAILLPFGTFLARAAEKILPEQTSASLSALSDLSAEFHQRNISLGSIAVHTNLLKQEIMNMINLSAENTKLAYESVLQGNASTLEAIEETEEKLDTLNKEISQYISKILVRNQNSENISDIEQYFLISGNIERIGDHAINIAGYAKVIDDKFIQFSESAKMEIENMQEIILATLSKLVNIDTDRAAWLDEIVSAEEQIDDMTISFREKHLERMRKGECSDEACILYSELLTDFERIGDHALNIGQAFAKINNMI